MENLSFQIVVMLSALTAYEVVMLMITPRKSLGDSRGLMFAKFTPGAIVSEIRNKIAATVFSKNRSGAVIRNRVTPINRKSAGQTETRQQLSSLSAQWRGLTTVQRQSWISAATSFPQTDNLGQTIFLSGSQIFVRCNANLILSGNAQIVSAPTPTSFDVLYFTSLTVTAATGVVTLAFSPTVPAGYELIIRATPPMSAGRSFVSDSSFRFVKSVAPAATSPQVLTSDYAAVFGSVLNSIDQKVFAEMFLIEQSSGLAGIPVRGSGIVV